MRKCCCSHSQTTSTAVALYGSTGLFSTSSIDALCGTMQSIAVRPFMLDSALSFVQPPSLEHRVKKEEAKSTFSRMFTWGGGKK